MNDFSAAQRRRVTMLDVAEHAGVSKASVSRFIGDDRALLSDAIALRIEQAISELGYRPNQMARGLKRGRTRLIGMLVADIRNPYSIAVMHGVETACRAHGYSLVVCNTDRDDEQESQHLAALRSYNIEGLIVNTLGHHPEQLRDLHREMPMVLVDRKVEHLHSDLVGLDNPAAVRMAVEHLEQQGYRERLGLTAHHLMDDELFPVASPALPGIEAVKEPRQIAQLPLVTDLALQGWRDWFRAAGVRGLRLPSMHSFNDSTDAMRAAVYGVGAALARRHVAQPYLQRYELVRLPGPALQARFAYYAVHPAHKPPSAAAQGFIDWLKEEARDERTPLPPMPDDFLGRRDA